MGADTKIGSIEDVVFSKKEGKMGGSSAVRGDGGNVILKSGARRYVYRGNNESIEGWEDLEKAAGFVVRS